MSTAAAIASTPASTACLELLAHPRLLERHRAQLGKPQQRLQLVRAEPPPGMRRARRQRPLHHPVPADRHRGAGAQALSGRVRDPLREFRVVVDQHRLAGHDHAACHPLVDADPPADVVARHPVPGDHHGQARVRLVAHHDHGALHPHDPACLPGEALEHLVDVTATAHGQHHLVERVHRPRARRPVAAPGRAHDQRGDQRGQGQVHPPLGQQASPRTTWSITTATSPATVAPPICRAFCPTLGDFTITGGTRPEAVSPIGHPPRSRGG